MVTQNNRKIREPIGSIRLLTIKSSKSSTVLPAPLGWKLLHTLKPSTQGMDATKRKIQFISDDFLRLMFHLSIQHATIFSNTAIMVEKEAKVINIKNKLPQIRPPFMDANTLGRVMKISSGPAPGSTPNAKHAGKIISPDVIATKVSSSLSVLTDTVKGYNC